MAARNDDGDVTRHSQPSRDGGAFEQDRVGEFDEENDRRSRGAQRVDEDVGRGADFVYVQGEFTAPGKTRAETGASDRRWIRRRHPGRHR